MRSPHELIVGDLLFRDLSWDVKVRSMSFDEDGLAEDLVVSVVINYRRHRFDSAVGAYISTEILRQAHRLPQ